MNDLIINDQPQDIPLWEKQPQESAKAFGAFKVYRDLATHKRSLKQAATDLYGPDHEHLISKMRQFQTWSAQYAWVARVAAWDEELDRQERDAHIQQVREMRVRHGKIGQVLQQKAVERLKKIIPEELSVEEMMSLLLSGTAMERKAVGEPDETHKVEAVVGVVDFSQMSEGELRKVLAGRIQVNLPAMLPGEDDDE